MSELRKDPVSGRWVIIARERADRPNPFHVYPVWTDDGKTCPFCPGNESLTPKEILAVRNDDGQKSGRAWSVRCVANLYPALRIEGGLDLRPEGLYDKMQGIGAHEVIVESPEHASDPSQFSLTQMATVLRVYRDRTLDLMRDVRFRYILVFKNHGQPAGATLAHTHSQIIALPIVPMQVERELVGANRYYEYRGRCVHCDIIAQESHDGRRVIVQNGDFIAFAPFASRFPFEIQILPLEHNAFFWKLSGGQIDRLAEILRDALRRYKLVLKDPPYNYVIHTAPPAYQSPERYHWQLQVIPRIIEVAGFEWGSGFYINPMPPEEAAVHLRDPERVMEIPEGLLLRRTAHEPHGT